MTLWLPNWASIFDLLLVPTQPMNFHTRQAVRILILVFQSETVQNLTKKSLPSHQIISFIANLWQPSVSCDCKYENKSENAFLFFFVGQRILLVELIVLFFQELGFLVLQGGLLFLSFLLYLTGNFVPECPELHIIFHPQATGNLNPRPHPFTLQHIVNKPGILGIVEIKTIRFLTIVMQGVEEIGGEEPEREETQINVEKVEVGLLGFWVRDWGTSEPFLWGDEEVGVGVDWDLRVETVGLREVALVQELTEVFESRLEATSECLAVHLIMARYKYKWPKSPRYKISYTNKEEMDWINQIKKINNKFKFQLFGKAVENLQKCYSKIGEFDPKSTGLMDEHTFNLFLNSFGIFLTTQEIRTIKEGFGKDGKIDYGEFIQNIRHDISEKRIATIDHCFEQLSTNGVIEIKQLFSRFDANNHPHNRCMTKPADKIRIDFETAILNRSADGKHLNESQFKQYYLDVNCCIPVEREEFFVDNLIHSYRLIDNRVTIDRLRQMEVTIYEKVRQKTYVKKDQGEKSKGGFRFFDMEDKGLVDYGRFVQTLERLGCKFTEKEMKVLYQKHAGNDGILTYEEMCGLLFEMGSGAKDNTNPVYELAKSNNGWGTTQGMSKKLI